MRVFYALRGTFSQGSAKDRVKNVLPRAWAREKDRKDGTRE